MHTKHLKLIWEINYEVFFIADVYVCMCSQDILIVTPEKWDSISRGWQKRNYVSKVTIGL